MKRLGDFRHDLTLYSRSYMTMLLTGPGLAMWEFQFSCPVRGRLYENLRGMQTADL